MTPAEDAATRDSALAALLEWHLACGVDLALDDAPHDRFAECAAAAREAPAPEIPVAPDAHPALEASCEILAPRAVRPAPARRQTSPPVFPQEALREAQAAAARAASLDELREGLMAYDGCGLKRLARHFHFCAGTPGARVMVVDIAPGEEEERSGEAFIGRPARLLDNMLAAIGLSRESAYLAYFSPWRPAADGAVPEHEAAALAPFARRHVELARPEVLLLLGDSLARVLLAASVTGAPLYGRWQDAAFGAAALRATTLPGLNSMLKTPALKAQAWKGLRAVARELR